MKQTVMALIVSLFLMAGCMTGVKPEGNKVPPAIKTLIVMQNAIISAAQTADLMCAQAVLTQKQCDEVNKVYTDSQPAYDAAADSLIVALRVPDADATEWEKYSYFHNSFLTIYTRMIALAVKYGIPGFGENGGAE